MKKLRPLTVKPEYYEAIEKSIALHLKREIYLKLLEELGQNPKILQNSVSDLLTAIQTSKIVYADGGFQGEFSAATSKALKGFGAKWDRKTGRWTLPRQKIPLDVLSAIGASEYRFKEMAAKIDRRLNDLLPEEIAKSLKIEKLFDSTIYKIDKDFEKTVANLTIEAKLTPEQKKTLAKKYTNNMELYIKDWTEKEIVKLRKQIQATTFSGNRYGDMVKTIQDSYGVSLNKAKFLARQETSLLMTTFKETRYKDAGIETYEWRTVVGSPKHPVRPMHKKLEGKIFSWDNPPITDGNGSRNHPGQDFNCRCQAVPIVKF